MKRILSRVLAAFAVASVFHAMAFAGLNGTSYDVGDGNRPLRQDVQGVRYQLDSVMSTGYENQPTPLAPVPAEEGQRGTCGCGQACGGCTQQGGCGSCGCGQNCCNSGCCNTCCETYCGGTCGCFEPCCHSSGLWASAELMFFRYHRADGVRVGTDQTGDDAEFDFEPTLRLTAGWVRDDGLGARLRYWEFDHSQAAGEGEPSHLSVDTYTFDFEVFDTFCLNRNWDLEIAAGVRYCEFEEVMADIVGDNAIRVNNFSGIGGVASAELRRLIGTSGSIWVRARTAILMDDKDVVNVGQGQQVRLNDVTVGMTEIAFGYDFVTPLCDGAYAFAGVQAEWQNWYNFSSGFEDTEDDQDFAGPADVGFGGFGFRVGVAR